MSAGANARREPARPTGWVWVDGELLAAGDRHLSAWDRGFQLGDGVFETLRVRASHPTELAEHTTRLRRSADGLAIALPEDLEARVDAGLRALLAAEGLDGPEGDASVRITVSRGVWAGRGTLPGEGEVLEATIVIQAWPVAPESVAPLDRGITVVTSAIRRDPGNPIVNLKTTSRADYVFAKLEARRASADDALFLTVSGHLSEATSANVFLVRRAPDGIEELATPALDCAILAGTTRSWLLAWGRQAGLRVVESWITADELAAADEAFLCASVSGIVPIASVDGRRIGADGRPGPWTIRARADREAFIRAEG